jgi:hypothetical protein
MTEWIYDLRAGRCRKTDGGQAMSDDKIAEIRERHAQSDNNFIEYESTWDIHADRATLLAEDARHRAQIERLRAENERLREVIRTIRARCVELDDSDAVSETLDIATAVLEDEP